MQVNVDDASADWAPVVVADSAGTAWVFWMGVEPGQGDFEIFSSHWTGSDWTPEEGVHADNFQKDAWPSACIGRDGIPWVVWERHRGGTSFYWDVLTVHWNGAGWSEPETVLVGSGEGQLYEMACADTGLVWAVVSTYVDRGGPWNDLDLFIRSRLGGTWSSLEHMDHPLYEDWYPDIALSGANVPWVVWRESDGADSLRCSFRDEAGWSESMLSIRGTAPGVRFSGGEGPWIVYGDSTYDVSSGFWDGERWSFSGPIPLVHAVPSEWDYAPRITGTALGGPVVVWPRADHENSSRGDVYVSRWLGCWWTAEELVTESDSELTAVDEFSSVSAGAGGRVWVAWERHGGPSGSDYDIWARYSDDFLEGRWIKSFSAQTSGGSVVLTWDCPGRVSFNVYRADAGGCGGPEATGDRVLVNPDPLAGLQSFVDSTADPGRRYRYWIEVVSPVGAVCEEAGPVLVRACQGGVRVGLLGVRPNPSGAGFVLGYYAAAERGVQLEVLDVSGRVVRRILATGVEGEVLWDGLDDRGKEVSPGVYFARLVAKERAIGRTEKLVIVR